MKKRLLLILLLVGGILVSLVSPSMAIYTNSFSYNGKMTLENRMKLDDFFHYKMVDMVAGSNVTYDSDRRMLHIQNEAGALLQFSGIPDYSAYVASVHINALNPAELKRIGFSFNGDAMITSAGYGKRNYSVISKLLYFDEAGIPYIGRQSFRKNEENQDTYVSQNLKQYPVQALPYDLDLSKGLDIAAYVRIEQQCVYAQLYLNGKRLHEKELSLGQTDNKFYGGSNQVTIGVSSYGAGRSIECSNLQVAPWDGVTLPAS